MFQQSIDRLLPIFGYQRIFVVAGKEHIEQLSKQVDDIPTENYIIEPYGKGTAPCIGLAAIHIAKRDPKSIMVVVTADHYIKNVEHFQNILNTAIDVAEKDHIVTLGISPSYPSTGYGYIEQIDEIDYTSDIQVFKVKRFLEKPNEENATLMVKSGNYSWNSGMFIWKIDRIKEEFKKQMPRLYKQLIKISNSIDKSNYDNLIKETWSEVERQTIDYGVMEGAKDVVVIPSEIGWSDIGSWTSLASLLDSDENDNVNVGNNINIDTFRSLIYGGKRLITTIGLEDIIIVDTDDALLVCTKKSDQKVRDIVAKIREQGLEEYL